MPGAPATGTLFETHLNVSDLERSIAFYSDILGLELAYVSTTRRAAFLWSGGRGCSMVGLWSGSSSPNVMQLHLAFRVGIGELLQWPARLAAAGITQLDFFGQPANEPSVIGWMPAASIFFRDPDQHLLEILAMLPHEAKPDAGVMTYSAWLEGAAAH